MEDEAPEAVGSAVPEEDAADSADLEEVPEDSDNVFALVHVLYAELDVGTTPIVILDD